MSTPGCRVKRQEDYMIYVTRDVYNKTSSQSRQKARWQCMFLDHSVKGNRNHNYTLVRYEMWKFLDLKGPSLEM